jgi:MYXO-CTERM domain-containing protein
VGSSLDDGTNTIEYQYRVDQGFWHPYTKARRIDVQDGWLRVQGKHVIEVRSKVAGAPMTLDPEPAQVEVVVDVVPPTIVVGKVDSGKVALTFKDKVSGDRTVARFRLDGGKWSDWQSTTALASLLVGEAGDLDVEAKDEEGNVASVSQELVRGRVEVPAGGCGCSVAGADESTPGSIWLLGVAVAGIASRLWKRDRSRKAATSRAPAALPKRTLRLRGVVAPLAVLALASTWAGCSCGGESTVAATGASSSGTGGSMVPGLDPGLIGAYTSTAVSGKTLWVAGYAEADWNAGNTYGDLVVGKWNGTKVDWESVDGVPSDPKPDPKTVDVNGFRGGQTDPGEDVGLWTSMALDSKGNPAVAYYDRTNFALKFAKYDGVAWTVSTVDGKAGADTGKYAKIVALGGGFVIAYSAVTSGGDKGALVSTIRVATSKSESPGAGEWTFEDAVTDKNTPCRASLCATGTACIAATKVCTTQLDDAKCTPSCASGSACVDNAGKGACAVTIDASKIDSYPEVVGDYVSIAVDPKGTIGIAYYDRIHGNLGVASHSSGAWVTTLVDGQDAMGNDTGDVGIGASLFIDASNDWHIAYVDGLAESLRYVKLTGGTKIGTPEVIDDGLGIAGKPFADGQHLVGDDANLVVTPSGEVRVSFQDATAGKLHYAVGALAADKHTWTVQELTQDHFAGAFSRVIELDGKIALVNWWRAGVPDVVGDVSVISP